MSFYVPDRCLGLAADLDAVQGKLRAGTHVRAVRHLDRILDEAVAPGSATSGLRATGPRRRGAAGTTVEEMRLPRRR